MELNDIPGMSESKSMKWNVAVGLVYFILFASIIGSFAEDPDSTGDNGVETNGNVDDMEDADNSADEEQDEQDTDNSADEEQDEEIYSEFDTPADAAEAGFDGDHSAEQIKEVANGILSGFGAETSEENRDRIYNAANALEEDEQFDVLAYDVMTCAREIARDSEAAEYYQGDDDTPLDAIPNVIGLCAAQMDSE